MVHALFARGCADIAFVWNLKLSENKARAGSQSTGNMLKQVLPILKKSLMRSCCCMQGMAPLKTPLCLGECNSCSQGCWFSRLFTEIAWRGNLLSGSKFSDEG